MIRIKVGMRIVSEDILIPLVFDLERYPHLLIVGPSGSGKSYALKYMFYSLSKYQDKIEVYCLDFKNSGDYEFIDEKHLSVGSGCLDMLGAIYKRYVEIKENNLHDIVLCCFDEYAAFINWLQVHDKKLAQKALDMASEVLMMGRRLNSRGGGCYMWTVLQRPDAAYFQSARDNYFVKIIMRDCTRSIRTMLELDEDEIPKEHIAKPGNGICMIENDVYAFRVPHFDGAVMSAMLKAKRSEAVSIADGSYLI